MLYVAFVQYAKRSSQLAMHA